MRLPEEFVKNMQKLLGDEYCEYEKCLDRPMHHGIRINTRKISVEDFLKINPFELEPVPWIENGFYYDPDKDKASKHPYYYAGLYYIQEPSAMTPACVLPINEGDRVLDICAAPGGKSTELAAKLNGTGILVSNDISASRAKALQKNIELFGIDNAIITVEPPVRLSERFEGYFDKILVDAPCSGEGMFRKSESMATAWENNGNQLFVDLQHQILTEVVKMLKPGGMMLYSTCTFSPLENEQALEYLLSLDCSLHIVSFDKYKDFDNGHIEWGNTGNPELCNAARLWPHRLEGEGHFTALIEKDDGDKSSYQLEYEIRKTVMSEEAREFLGHIKKEIDYSRIEIADTKLYYIPKDFPAVKGLRLLRCGLYLGEQKKKRFEPSQSLAVALNGDEFDNTVNFSKDDIRVIKYLKGETIDVDAANGWVLVLVDSYPLGWGKISNGTMKNKYLAGWRMM